MSEISANLIKELRDKTGAGILDCKKALVESGGNLEEAIDFLRKTGAAKAEKKSGRITSEGRVSIQKSDSQAVVVEVNCETDFVAKNPDFQNFTEVLAQHLLKNRLSSLEDLLKSKMGPQTVQEVLQGLVLKIGENISVRRFQYMTANAEEKIGSYIHMGNKIGVLVRMKGPSSKLTEEVLKDVAMHAAAASPQYLSKELIPREAIEREKAIYQEQMKELNKPAPVLEKILEGKLSRFADEVCLVQQPFVKDPSGKLSVSLHLQAIDPQIQVLEFIRYQVGEGIAKKEEDFAAEVAKQLKG